MRWNDIRIEHKMKTNAACMITLLLVIGVWAIYGLSSVVEDGMEVADGNALQGELLQREVDHLNWSKAVATFLGDNQVNELNVQLDHTKCGFGKWYYGQGRKQAEQLLPELGLSLQEIEAPHKNLHESARAIQKTYKPADMELPAFLTRKELDHVAWTSKIQDAIIAARKSVGVELDHTKCSFGQFLYGEKGAEMAAADKVLAHLLETVEGPHKKLHANGGAIDASLADGNVRKATAIYRDEVLPVLADVRALLNKMQVRAEQNLQGRMQAEQIYAGETQKHLSRVQTLLRGMTELARDNILSEDQMITNARNTRMAVIILGLVAIAAALALAYFISRSITVPIEETVRINKKVALGDLTVVIEDERKDEIGDMLTSMKEMVANLKDTADLAEQLARGDLNVEARILSDKDVLGQSLARMIESLKSTAMEAEQIAGGDLTVEVQLLSDRDELGISLQAMVKKLRQVIGDVQAAVDQVAGGSQELSSSSQVVSQGASEQAASVEEISTSMEELSSTVANTADNARETANIAGKSAENAEKGGQAVVETVNAMQNIADKIEVVEEIARQTNMLALNAAIEAARAGEHGKGFAVVASAVRKLAEKSQTAAQDIKDIADCSVDTATNAGELIREIVPQILKTAELVQEIDAASTEQARGISENARAMEQFDQVIQNNSAAAEEMAATSEELTAQAETLQDAIAYFNVDKSADDHPGPGSHSGTYPHKMNSRKLGSLAESSVSEGEKPGIRLSMHGEGDSEFSRY